MNRRTPFFIFVFALMVILAFGLGGYLAFGQRRAPSPARVSTGATPTPAIVLGVAPATPSPLPTRIRPQDIGLPANATELQKEIEKRSAGKSQLSFTLPDDFPQDFPVYPGARLLSAIRSSQEGVGLLVAWVSDDDSEKVQAFYEERMQQTPWSVVSPFAPGIIAASSQRNLAFGRLDDASAAGVVTVGREATGRGKTSIDVSYRKP